MKINSITSYGSSINLKNTSNTRRNVAFGFGEDYGTNPFVDPQFENGKKPSTWNAIKAIFGASIALGGELLGSDKKRLDEIERIGIQAQIKEELEAERAKAEAEKAKKLEDDDYDDYEEDSDDYY